jgi:hypothetical protein
MSLYPIIYTYVSLTLSRRSVTALSRFACDMNGYDNVNSRPNMTRPAQKTYLHDRSDYTGRHFCIWMNLALQFRPEHTLARLKENRTSPRDSTTVTKTSMLSKTGCKVLIVPSIPSTVDSTTPGTASSVELTPCAVLCASFASSTATAAWAYVVSISHQIS